MPALVHDGAGQYWIEYPELSQLFLFDVSQGVITKP